MTVLLCKKSVGTAVVHRLPLVASQNGFFNIQTRGQISPSFHNCPPLNGVLSHILSLLTASLTLELKKSLFHQISSVSNCGSK